MLSIKKFMKNTKIIISTLAIAITFFATFQSNILAQVAGNQFDSHPMHWARYWDRATFDRNLIYAEGWNLGTIEGTRWPGSEGLSYLNEAIFFVASYVTDMQGYQGTVIPDERDGSQFGIVSNAYLPHVSQATVAQLSSDRSHQQIWQP